jgi:hypothetical protein
MQIETREAGKMRRCEDGKVMVFGVSYCFLPKFPVSHLLSFY